MDRILFALALVHGERLMGEMIHRPNQIWPYRSIRSFTSLGGARRSRRGRRPRRGHTSRPRRSVPGLCSVSVFGY